MAKAETKAKATKKETKTAKKTKEVVTEKDLEAKLEKEIKAKLEKEMKAKLEKQMKAKLEKKIKADLLKEMEQEQEDTTKEEALEDREINRTTKVVVSSNVDNRVSFEMANQRSVTLTRLGQTKEVLVDDLEYLMSVAPAMLTEGIIIIDDKDVREHLDLTEYYENGAIVKNKEIIDLLKLSGEELEVAVENASATVKNELVRLAFDERDSLTGGQVKIIEEKTKSILSEPQ